MTDAFEKLAELVGASVEASPSQGLPRTQAEALALGVKRYFTGKPCKRGHVESRLVSTKECDECFRLRNATPERKEWKRQYNTSPEYKEWKRQRAATPEYKERKRQRAATPEYKERERQRAATPERKERKRQYNTSPEVKEYKRQHELKRTGDATLFAINQAAAYAERGIAYDIVPQCPEPHRSQLQALIERIRADPTAGKAVIGLLRSMRELRKLELAEQNTKDDTTASSP